VKENPRDVIQRFIREMKTCIRTVMDKSGTTDDALESVNEVVVAIFARYKRTHPTIFTESVGFNEVSEMRDDRGLINGKVSVKFNPAFRAVMRIHFPELKQ
jgi:hypothetical protein